MKQKMLIFLALIFLGILLVGLNAATYVQKEKVPDTEYAPNRSTYNSGSTGSQAFYSLLSETGRKVRRWQSPLDTIDTDGSERPSVFVMIGPHRRELTEVENTHLMRWVANGGTLVLIDREPRSELAVSTAQWKISVKPQTNPDIFSVDATNHAQMTADTAAVKPSFPSFFTHGVNAVQPSRFASSIDLERFKDLGDTTDRFKRIEAQPPPPPPPIRSSPTPHDFYNPDTGSVSPEDSDEDDTDTGSAEPYQDETDEAPSTLSFDAPIVHVGGQGRNLLVEAPFSAGRGVIL
jgi:hypothetical protein